jgi:hypothetical protein
MEVIDMAGRKDIHQEYKELIEALTHTYQYPPGELFRWMLEDALCQLGVLKESNVPEDALERVCQCGRAYTRMLAGSAPFTDVLGSVYMSLASQWGQKALGQYFTPQSVAKIMAQMTLGEPSCENGRLTTTCDPCCGSGVMLLSLLQTVLERDGKAALRHWSVTGVDLDPVCAAMCAVQLLGNCAVHDLPIGEIVVIQGDSLFPERLWKPVLHATAARTPSVPPVLHPARADAVKAAALQNAEQLELFTA